MPGLKPGSAGYIKRREKPHWLKCVCFAYLTRISPGNQMYATAQTAATLYLAVTAHSVCAAVTIRHAAGWGDSLPHCEYPAPRHDVTTSH